MIKLFTDIDLDGMGCGLLAKIAFGEKANVFYCSYRNLDKRVESFIEKPESHKAETYITDLAVGKAVEEKLEKRFKKGRHIRVIDHHVTALHFNNYEWGMVKPEYDNGKKTCAASLFYEYLVDQKKLDRTAALDEFVDLVRQYDTWEWEENDNPAAKRLNDLFYIIGREQFEEEMLLRLAFQTDSFELSETENKLLDIEEKKIERYIHSKNRQMVQAFIDDYYVGIVHAEQYLSELGNELNKQNPHLDMVILLNVGGKKMGFRTIHDHINVAEYAKTFGGGGHPKASGCDLTEEAFKKYVINVYPFEPLKPDAYNNEFNVKGAKYGASYQNRKGNISVILPLQDGTFSIIHEGNKIKQEFWSYNDAENFLKRNYASWLRHDEEYLHHLSITHSIAKDELKRDFAGFMKKLK